MSGICGVFSSRGSLTLTAWVLEAPTGNSGNWQRFFNKGTYAMAQQDPNQIIAIIDPAGWTTAVPAAEASEGKWRFVAVTYGGSDDPNRTTYGIYDDDDVIDVLHSGIVAQEGTGTSGLNVLIGGGQPSAPDPSYNYGGSVDDVRVYNYALTADDIQGLYSAMTSQALCMDIDDPGLEYDFNLDCKVSLEDFASFAAAWLNTQLQGP